MTTLRKQNVLDTPREISTNIFLKEPKTEFKDKFHLLENNQIHYELNFNFVKKYSTHLTLEEMRLDVMKTFETFFFFYNVEKNEIIRRNKEIDYLIKDIIFTKKNEGEDEFSWFKVKNKNLNKKLERFEFKKKRESKANFSGKFSNDIILSVIDQLPNTYANHRNTEFDLNTLNNFNSQVNNQGNNKSDLVSRGKTTMIQKLKSKDTIVKILN